MTAPQHWKKLIVPTDFSSCALAGLRAAAEIRGAAEVEVVIVHVAEPASHGLRVQTDDLHEQWRREAEASLKCAVDDFFPNVPGVRTLVVEGKPAEMICQTAEGEAADVIIIPTHGHSGLKHALLGSVAEKVVRHAPCSVLVVRD